MTTFNPQEGDCPAGYRERALEGERSELVLAYSLQTRSLHSGISAQNSSHCSTGAIDL